MPHPALHLLATHPQWLAEHAAAYAQLAGAELDDATSLWGRRLWLGGLTMCALMVAATLGGVALMLWAVTPELPAPRAWALLAAPALPLALAGVGWLALRRLRQGPLFFVLRQQWQTDAALLRQTAGP